MWLNCTPSARLSEKYERRSNEASDEGKLAHQLSELLIKVALNRVTKVEYAKQNLKIKANRHYTASMLEHCSQFASYVMEQFNAMKEKHRHAAIFLEVKLDLTRFIPEGFGTGDVVILAGNEILVIDLKYGKGVFVHTEENTQMMIYAIGAIEAFSSLTDVKKVRMTIYQPRLDNIDTWETSYKSLMDWANSVLRKQAAIAFKGKGQLVAGTHCQFCPVKATCKANAAYNQSLAKGEFDETSEPTELNDKELVELYLRAKQIRSWLTAIEDHMLEKAITGKTWKGLKLVHGRSVRQISDPKKVEAILKRMKLPEKQYLSEPQLLGITALEANIGAQLFAKMAGKFVVKPVGKPSLVHADSKGQTYSGNNSAIEDFS